MRSPAQIQILCLRIAAVCAGTLVSVSQASAQQQIALDAIGLVETFTDVTVSFQTPLGVELPVRFHGDRSLSGNSGRIARHLGSESDRGRWWTEGSQLCQKWNVWFDSKTTCVMVFRSGDQIVWKGQNGRTGLGQIVRRRVVTQTNKPQLSRRRLPLPSALGASVPQLARPSEPATSDAIGRYSQPLKEERHSFRISKVYQGKALQVVAYPSSTSEVVGQVSSGTRELAGWGACANSWCPVVLKGQHGWLRQKYLERSRGQLGVGQRGAGLLYRVSGVKSWDVLNVRQQPMSSAAIVGQLSFKARNIKLVGACRKLWCPVRMSGRRGWVHSHYLAIQ